MIDKTDSKEREDVELSRACVKAWDSSGFTSNPMDAVHPMFSAAFELGYRASLAASAGSEPVAWRIDWPDEPALGHYFSEAPTDSGRCQPLYTHPSPPEGMVGGLQDIATAPKDGTYLLLWEQYSTNPFVGRWAFGSWRVSHEHVDAEGGWDGAIVVDSIDQDRITHWMPLTTSAGSGKGE